MQVLVTGANGFIGKKLVNLLLKKSINTIGLDLTKDAIIQCDLLNPNEIKTVFDEYSPEIIIHLAAISSTQKSVQTAIKTQNINFLGTVNLLEIALNHNSELKYFVLASSAEVYGGLSDRYYNEKDLVEPITPYAASKAAAESFVLMRGHQNGLKTCCIRFCNTFGRIDNNTFLIEYLFHSFLTNKIPVINAPNSVREFMYFPDHLRVYESILDNQPSGIINASSGESSSILEIANKIKKITGKKIQITTNSEINPTKILLNTEKLQKLGYKKKYSVDKGLATFYGEIGKLDNV